KPSISSCYDLLPHKRKLLQLTSWIRSIANEKHFCTHRSGRVAADGLRSASSNGRWWPVPDVLPARGLPAKGGLSHCGFQGQPSPRAAIPNIPLKEEITAPVFDRRCAAFRPVPTCRASARKFDREGRIASAPRPFIGGHASAANVWRCLGVDRERVPSVSTLRAGKRRARRVQ